MGQSKSRLQRVKERAQQCDGASSLHQLLAAEKIDVNEQITVLHGETVTCRLSVRIKPIHKLFFHKKGSFFRSTASVNYL